MPPITGATGSGGLAVARQVGLLLALAAIAWLRPGPIDARDLKGPAPSRKSKTSARPSKSPEYRVRFDRGTLTMHESQVREIDKAGQYATIFAMAQVEVTGRANAGEPDSQKLAEGRAAAVAEALSRRFPEVTPQRIRTRREAKPGAKPEAVIRFTEHL